MIATEINPERKVGKDELGRSAFVLHNGSVVIYICKLLQVIHSILFKINTELWLQVKNA